MNEFISAFVSKLKQIKTKEELLLVYDWLWRNQLSVRSTAQEINRELRLSGPYELKEDLPCLSVGSHKGLVVLGANPGWKRDRNPRENAYCRESPGAYADMMFNYFECYPRVVGARGRWWPRAMTFLQMLPDGYDINTLGKQAIRWQ
ncbi:MAG TPA: hypothetical protein VMJ32_15980 [Pirellulales bacterium]|nr:hypothetical protein [Pirellulales bacterium]